MKLINRSNIDITLIILSIVLACAIWAWVKRDMICSDTVETSYSKKALQCTSNTDNKKRRFFNMLSIAFGQSKMVVKPIAGILHFIVYLGFIIINIEFYHYININII